MKLARQLLLWREAGLLDEATCTRIAEYEAQRPRRPYMLYTLGGLGALCVCIGLVSIVAANWQEIPEGVKLGLALLWLTGLAVGVYVSDQRSAPGGEQGLGQGHDEESFSFTREVLLFIFYGSVLATIGLVGQVYHLGGELRHALLLWSLVTLPVATLGRSRMFLAVWIIALLATWYLNLAHEIDRFRDKEEVVLACAAAWSTGLLLLGAGLIPPLRRRRPELPGILLTFGSMHFLWLASMATLGWYERGHWPQELAAGSLGLALLLSGLIAFALPRSLDRGGRRLLQVALLYGTLQSHLPLLLHHPRLNLLGAVAFLVLWVLVAWAALRVRSYALFNLATALLGLRVLIIYFEVFGSLLSTGIGLLSGGVLTLLLAFVWLRKTRQMQKAARAEVAHA